MTVAQGFDAIAAVAKAATWGTAVSVNSTNTGIKLLNENITTTVNHIDNDSLNGTSSRDESDRGAIGNTGDFNLYLKYDGLDMLLGMAMYRADTPISAVKTGGNGPYAYYHSFKLPSVGTAETCGGYFYTMAIDKTVSIHEYDSIKNNGMTITGNAGERLQLSFDTIARRMRNSGQTNSSLASVTVPSPEKYIMFEDCTVRIKEQSGAAMTNPADRVYPNSFTISLNNNLEADLTTENDPYVDEPTRDEFLEVTGSFGLPKYTNDTTLTAFLAGARMKADIRAISSTQIPNVGGGAYYYAFNMYMPSIVITEAGRQVADAGKIGAPVSFKGEKASTAPDGMDGSGALANRDAAANGEAIGSITLPLEIEVMNLRKTSPFA